MLVRYAGRYPAELPPDVGLAVCWDPLSGSDTETRVTSDRQNQKPDIAEGCVYRRLLTVSQKLVINKLMTDVAEAPRDFLPIRSYCTFSIDRRG